MDEEKTDEIVEEKVLTPEELTAEWIKIYKVFANPKCTAKDCYGRGYTGINTKTGQVIGCTKKRCAVVNLKRFELIQRHKKRLEKEQEKESEGATEGPSE